MTTEFGELLRCFQELHDLLKLGNSFIRPAHIFVCDRNILGLNLDRFALADPKNAAHSCAGGTASPPVSHVPETAEQYERKKVLQQNATQGVRWALEAVSHICVLQLFDQLGIAGRRR